MYHDTLQWEQECLPWWLQGENYTSWTSLVLATWEVDWNSNSVGMAQAWHWVLSRGISSFSARVWQVQVSQEGSPHRKKVQCALISQCVWYRFPQQGLPQHNHTQLGGVRVRTFLWKCLQEGKTHLEGFIQERLATLCYWVRLSKGPVFRAVLSLCYPSGK